MNFGRASPTNAIADAMKFLTERLRDYSEQGLTLAELKKFVSIQRDDRLLTLERTGDKIHHISICWWANPKFLAAIAESRNGGRGVDYPCTCPCYSLGYGVQELKLAANDITCSDDAEKQALFERLVCEAAKNANMK